MASGPVYVLAQLNLHDRERYGAYVHAFRGVLGRYGGQLLAADEAPLVVEGQWERDKVVLVRFADEASFHAWARSDAYQAIAQDRLASTEGPVLLVRGLR